MSGLNLFTQRIFYFWSRMRTTRVQHYLRRHLTDENPMMRTDFQFELGIITHTNHTLLVTDTSTYRPNDQHKEIT